VFLHAEDLFVPGSAVYLVQRNILEDPARGFLANDTIIIKYTIELVVSSGGALSRSSNGPSKAELIKVPPPSIGKDLGELFYSGAQQQCSGGRPPASGTV
jgi:hypothetical protein